MSAKESLPIKLVDCPEEVTEDGLKIYGETSLENQMAVLSHYLHGSFKLDEGNRRDILDALKDYLDVKEFRQKSKVEQYETFEEWDDEKISKVADEAMQYGLFDDFFQVPFPAPENPRFTFIDLFAGIGGFRIALQHTGGKCIYSSEWDAQAQKTYLANFGEMPFGDITKESTKKYIPNKFDVLCAGFPCQPFSISGKQKGFEDTRGTLFFDVCQIYRSISRRWSISKM